MRYDGYTLSDISKFIAGRTEAQPLQRQQYYEQLTYNINNLKKQSLNYYLTVVMKIRQSQVNYLLFVCSNGISTIGIPITFISHINVYIIIYIYIYHILYIKYYIISYYLFINLIF